jgi:hypothetical protein
MLGMASIKLLLLPIMGVALVQYLTFHTTLIPADALALRFVRRSFPLKTARRWNG